MGQLALLPGFPVEKEEVGDVAGGAFDKQEGIAGRVKPLDAALFGRQAGGMAVPETVDPEGAAVGRLEEQFIPVFPVQLPGIAVGGVAGGHCPGAVTAGGRERFRVAAGSLDGEKAGGEILAADEVAAVGERLIVHPDRRVVREGGDIVGQLGIAAVRRVNGQFPPVFLPAAVGEPPADDPVPGGGEGGEVMLGFFPGEEAGLAGQKGEGAQLVYAAVRDAVGLVELVHDLGHFNGLPGAGRFPRRPFFPG